MVGAGASGGAGSDNAHTKSRWWQEWLRPPSLFTVASFLALGIAWYCNVGAHCADAMAARPRYHHTLEELRQEFMPLDLHLQQQRDEERRLAELNAKVDQLNQKVDRLLERR